MGKKGTGKSIELEGELLTVYKEIVIFIGQIILIAKRQAPSEDSDRNTRNDAIIELFECEPDGVRNYWGKGKIHRPFSAIMAKAFNKNVKKYFAQIPILKSQLQERLKAAKVAPKQDEIPYAKILEQLALINEFPEKKALFEDWTMRIAAELKNKTTHQSNRRPLSSLSDDLKSLFKFPHPVQAIDIRQRYPQYSIVLCTLFVDKRTKLPIAREEIGDFLVDDKDEVIGFFNKIRSKIFTDNLRETSNHNEAPLKKVELLATRIKVISQIEVDWPIGYRIAYDLDKIRYIRNFINVFRCSADCKFTLIFIKKYENPNLLIAFSAYRSMRYGMPFLYTHSNPSELEFRSMPHFSLLREYKKWLNYSDHKERSARISYLKLLKHIGEPYRINN